MPCTDREKVSLAAYNLIEYDAQFTTLAHYAEHLIPNDSMKARRFEEGLQPNVRRAVKLLKLQTYAEVLDRALMLETEEENNKRIRELKKRRYANSNHQCSI
ncbi:hypothetical protein RHGRI_030706 [Rhododendron griersonianum]|uniref:Uncharacterized protein n=1 Tax=Rhododendron griersonianum TaxID=479676 RepID=A0AAV6I5J9_9ERIC|nr:hypothetical protein RHGRI_030706 [Rhododendron griersonianum]